MAVFSYAFPLEEPLTSYIKEPLFMTKFIVQKQRCIFHVHTVHLDNYQSFFHQLMHNLIVLKTILNLH